MQRAPGGTSRLLSQVLPKQGINVSNVDMTDLAAVRGAYLALVCVSSVRATDVLSSCLAYSCDDARCETCDY